MNKEKYKRKKKKKEAHSKLDIQKLLNYMRLALFIAALVAVFYPPYLRGLYFETEALPTQIFVFLVLVLFWIYKFIKKDGVFLKTPVEYAAFGFVIAYFLSIFAAAGLRLAIEEWLKYCMYFAMFYMLSELTDNLWKRKLALWVITLSALGVCLLGIDGAAGLHLSNALNSLFTRLGSERQVFFGLFVANRINSTIQYPNTLAAYLMATLFISLGLAIVEKKPWLKIPAAASGFIMLITFIFTYSRGAYIIIPVAAALFLAVLPKDSRKGAIFHSLAVVLPLMVVINRLSPYFSGGEERKERIWLFILLGTALSAILELIAFFTVRYLEKIHSRVYIYSLALLASLAVIAAVIALQSHVPLHVDNSGIDAKNSVLTRKSIILKPGRDYKAVFEIDAAAGREGDGEGEENAGNAYRVSVSSANLQEVLTGRSKPVASSNGAVTKGFEENEISFSLPEDSRACYIDFRINPGFKATVRNARIIEAGTGKVAKNIVLKYKYLPESIVSRLEALWASRNFLSRVVFMLDALKIMKKNILIGAGGGAWSLLYFSHQSFLYWTTQAHNFPAQLGVECGIVGLGVLVFLIVSLFLTFIKSRPKIDRESGIIAGTALTAVFALLAHSAVDFDLSLGAVSLLLWECLALFNSYIKQHVHKPAAENASGQRGRHGAKLAKGVSSRHAAVFLIGLGATIGTLVLSIIFNTAAAYSSAAEKAAKKNEPGTAAQYYHKALSTDPFKPAYRFNYASTVLNGKNKITPAELAEVKTQMIKAEAYGRNDVNMLANLGVLYLNKLGDIEKGIELIERATMLRPLRPEEWGQMANACRAVAMNFFKKEDAKSALSYIDRALAMINKAKEINKGVIVPFTFDAKTQEILEQLSFIKNAGSELNKGKIVFNSMPDMDIDSNGVPDQWTPNDSAAVKIWHSEGAMNVESPPAEGGKAYNYYIQSRLLELLPGKSYRIEVETAGGTLPGNTPGIPFIVTAVTGKALTLTPQAEDNKYAAEILAPEKFDNKSVFLRIFVNGRYTFKSIRVFEK